VGNGGGLQAVEFVEDTVDGGVGDEVVDIIIFCCLPLGFVDEGRGTGKGVVDISDQLRVRESFPS